MRPWAVLCLLTFALAARGEGGYTNHAGNVVAGWPVALTATQVTLGRGGVIDPALPGIVGRAVSTKPPRGETYPLSIFPESEQRPLAEDLRSAPAKSKRTF